MKKRRAALCLLLAASLALAGCGKKSAPVETPAPDYSINAAEATPAVSAAPKISEKYNSIDDTARAEKNAVRDELLSVADGCRDIYEQADKGTAINVVLSTATVQASHATPIVSHTVNPRATPTTTASIVRTCMASVKRPSDT